MTDTKESPEMVVWKALQASVVGQSVASRGVPGTVLDYRPLGCGLCDLLVQFDVPLWVASHEVYFLDGSRLPTRSEVQRVLAEARFRTLVAIREQLVSE